MHVCMHMCVCMYACSSVCDMDRACMWCVCVYNKHHACMYAQAEKTVGAGVTRGCELPDTDAGNPFARAVTANSFLPLSPSSKLLTKCGDGGSRSAPSMPLLQPRLEAHSEVCALGNPVAKVLGSGQS